MDVGAQDAATEDVERVADVADGVAGDGLGSISAWVGSAEDKQGTNPDVVPPVCAGRIDLEATEFIVQE